MRPLEASSDRTPESVLREFRLCASALLVAPSCVLFAGQTLRRFCISRPFKIYFRKGVVLVISYNQRRAEKASQFQSREGWQNIFKLNSHTCAQGVTTRSIGHVNSLFSRTRLACMIYLFVGYHRQASPHVKCQPPYTMGWCQKLFDLRTTSSTCSPSRENHRDNVFYTDTILHLSEDSGSALSKSPLLVR